MKIKETISTKRDITFGDLSVGDVFRFGCSDYFMVTEEIMEEGFSVNAVNLFSGCLEFFINSTPVVFYNGEIGIDVNKLEYTM